MNSYNLENFERPKLTMPNNGKKLLMHSCCAPCAGEIMEAVAASGIETTIYFYNPCLLYTSPSPRDQRGSRMPSSA